MSHLLSAPAAVGVIGAGTMGAGIAQVAAAAGHPVYLTDARAGAAAAARERIATALTGLVARGKLDTATAEATVARIQVVEALADMADAALVVEAIIEDLQAKQALMRELEQHVSAHAVLATNTSSISVTAIANGMQHPQRMVGMHFFNPVPQMKLVEVVPGAETSREVAQAIAALSKAWGKTAVLAASTPGFIVNRIARPFYAEALQLLQEQAGTPAQLDRAMRAAGFRMGPCELMDLIGHDVNYSVTCSVFDANHGDKRFQPSLVQKALIDGGRLGRKVGKGFYEGQPVPLPDAVAQGEAAVLTLCGDDPLVDRLAAMFDARGVHAARERSAPWAGLRIGDAALPLSDGRTAAQLAHQLGEPNLAVLDLPLSSNADALALAYAPRVAEADRLQIEATLISCGLQPVVLRDVPGLLVARTVAMLVNEASDAVWQGVCTEEAADLAMTLGVNYPLGPFAWLQQLGVQRVIGLLGHLFDAYRSERYRMSPMLRQKQWY